LISAGLLSVLVVPPIALARARGLATPERVELAADAL
jgi:hypothetical protein